VRYDDTNNMVARKEWTVVFYSPFDIHHYKWYY